MAGVAAVLAAVAAWLLVGPNPASRLGVAASSRRAWPAWVGGRPDAIALPVRAGIGAALGLVVWLLLGWPAWSLPMVIAGVGVPAAVGLGLLEPAATRRRSHRLIVDLPHACELLAACLDAGLALRVAAGTVGEAVGGPVGDEFARVTRQIDLGVPDEEAWAGLTDPALRRLGRDLGRAAGAGLVASEPLRAIAADATRRADGVRQEAAKRVGVTSVVPLMVCFLPAFMLLGIVPIVGGYVVSVLGG